RAVEPNLERRAQDRIGGAELVTRRAFHGLNREIAGVQNQLVARDPIQVKSYRALQNLAVESNVDIQMQVTYADQIRTRPCVDIHRFHDRIQAFPPSDYNTLMQKRVLAVVSDLFFSVKLTDAAKRTGLALEFVKDSGEVMEKAKDKPSLIVFDLNYDAANPLHLIAA